MVTIGELQELGEEGDAYLPWSVDKRNNRPDNAHGQRSVRFAIRWFRILGIHSGYGVCGRLPLSSPFPENSEEDDGVRQSDDEEE